MLAGAEFVAVEFCSEGPAQEIIEFYKVQPALIQVIIMLYSIYGCLSLILFRAYAFFAE